jgi:hypothetical protein
MPFEVALQRELGRRVGFLQIDTPILEIRKANRFAADRTAHIITRRDNLELAIQIANLGFVLQAKKFFDTIHSGSAVSLVPRSGLSATLGLSQPGAPHKGQSRRGPGASIRTGNLGYLNSPHHQLSRRHPCRRTCRV